MKILILLLGIILGYYIAYVVAEKKSGKPGLIKSRIFKIKDYKIHLHHWVSSSIILIVLVLLDFYNDIIYGFLIGVIIQGLTYRDFYKILYKE